MSLLSIVVPTHNRARYAKYCIDAVLSLQSPELQLVVADTSSDGELYDWLHNGGSNLLADQRLVYRKIDYPSNVTRNHNDAMALASGEYVCVIGDDDCATSAALEAARWASTNGIDAVSQTQTSIYAWPDFRSQTNGTAHAGRLYVPRGIGKVSWRDAEADLIAALHRACQATTGLPRTYHGIVRRSLFEQLRERTGAYYHGSSPDISAAIAIACMIESYCEVELPLTISGISSGSNSGRSAMNTHKGDLSSDPQTREFEASGWPAGVPRIFAVETVWAHAGLEILRRLRPDLLPRFNYPHLLALCTMRHSDFSDSIDRAKREVAELTGSDPSQEIKAEIRRQRSTYRKYLARRMLIPTAANGRRYFKNLSNVFAVSQRFEAYAREQGLKFDCAAQRLEREARV